MEDPLGIIQGNSPPNEFDCFFVTAGVMGSQAEKMPGVGVARLGLDDLAVGVLGLAKTSRLVVPEGDCQQLIWSRHGAFSWGNRHCRKVRISRNVHHTRITGDARLAMRSASGNRETK